MEDNNRINRRSRPRPYDLRRKVLLKNFLREQMTHIPLPEPRIELASQDDISNFSQNLVDVSFGPKKYEPIDEDLPSLPDTSIDIQSTPSLCDNIESNPTITDLKDVSDNKTDNSLDSNSTQESSLFKFSSLVKFKNDSKKTLKGILKAKDKYKNVKSPMKTRSFKSGLERVFYGRKRPSESTASDQIRRNSARSLFSVFKNRKEQRNVKETASIRRSACSNLKTVSISSKFSTLNQSVQTDDSWTREELIRVQQSNKRLKEENRLLSESLSFFMSNTSMDPQVKHCNSPLQSSNKNVNSTVFPDYYVSSSNSASGSTSWSPRSRVTRSKSVQCNERKLMSRNNYRTRSMSYHNYRNNVLSVDIKPSASEHRAQSHALNIPRMRRKNMINLPINNGVRGIQRRSSMPERILSENDRSIVCRRSGSFRDSHFRKPFNSLPSEAFY